MPSVCCGQGDEDEDDDEGDEDDADSTGVDEIKSDSSDTSVQACKRHQRSFPSLLQREEGADAQLHTCLCATIIIILWCSLLLEYCTDSPSSSSSTPTPCLSEWD